MGASSLSRPSAVAFLPNELLIVDTGNNRILGFGGTSTIAMRVLGQPDFIHRTLGSGVAGLAQPSGIATYVEADGRDRPLVRRRRDAAWMREGERRRFLGTAVGIPLVVTRLAEHRARCIRGSEAQEDAARPGVGDPQLLDV